MSTISLDTIGFAIALEVAFQRDCATYRVKPTGWRRGVYGVLYWVPFTSRQTDKAVLNMFRSGE